MGLRDGLVPTRTLPLLGRVNHRRAFTLVELLVVVGIIAVLLALLLPAIQRVRATVDRMDCQANLRSIGQALAQYHLDHQRLPPGCGYPGGADPTPHLSWLARLLPYLGEEPLWRETQAAFAADKFFVQAPHHTVQSRVLPIFLCPSDDRGRQPILHPSVLGGNFQPAYTSYLGCNGTDQTQGDGTLYLDSRVKWRDLSDGLSSTMVAGERPPSAALNSGWWYAGWGMNKSGAGDSHLGVRERNTYPPNYPYGGDLPPGPYSFGPGRIDEQVHLFHFWSLHPGGAHFLFGDGSVRFLSWSADAVLPALATRAGKEIGAVPD